MISVNYLPPKHREMNKQIADLSNRHRVVVIDYFNYIWWKTNSAKPSPSRKSLTCLADNFLFREWKTISHPWSKINQKERLHWCSGSSRSIEGRWPWNTRVLDWKRNWEKLNILINTFSQWWMFIEEEIQDGWNSWKRSYKKHRNKELERGQKGKTAEEDSAAAQKYCYNSNKSWKEEQISKGEYSIPIGQNCRVCVEKYNAQNGLRLIKYAKNNKGTSSDIFLQNKKMNWNIIPATQ